MKFEISFEKKHFWMMLSMILVLFIGVVVYAYTQAIPSPGHGADSVLVLIPGVGEKTLQAAIDDKSIGGAVTYTPGFGISISNGVISSTVSGGIASETDPTVPASIKDGIDWTEVSNKPAFISLGQTWTVNSNADGGGWVLVTDSASPSCSYIANAYPTWRPSPGSYNICQTYMYRTYENGASLYVMTNCGYTYDGAKIKVIELC